MRRRSRSMRSITAPHRLLDTPDLVFSEIGAKGVGEVACVGAAGAIANAIYHATGKRVRDLPIRIEAFI